ncbi:hypothetical protein C8J27_102200 [Rhodobacter aestuarii]|uniref:Uncharacterized protein n=1 Tax=Rhodobacter aestuarii TaxID=453582 RepID=A0A1N7NEE8_9RHOB|nr:MULTISPECIES: hypothetical protein [Rhodobacter]PTV96406.1 hypothetical protein C8J27_102200 [Rhodobacter aestuarii]SIS96601.1 hypothetical protein SAMN05421580_107200 [Rhodobacter aestuarii]SOB92337.1 hypothetical protein SAMN05877809_101533 [Rhodobacter sp. JA431]
MKDHALRLINDERLIEATHWTVFSLGALSLAVAVGGTAWTAFFA